MPSLNPFQLGCLKSAASLFIVTVFCWLSPMSVASAGAIFAGSGPCCSSTPSPQAPLEPGFTFTYGDSGDITVDHPNGVTVNNLGNKLEFTSGDSTSSITFLSNTFSFSILTPLAVLVSNFDATGISIDGGGGLLRFEGPVVAKEISSSSISGGVSLGASVFDVILGAGGSIIIGISGSNNVNPANVNPAIGTVFLGSLQDVSPFAFVSPIVAGQPLAA